MFERLVETAIFASRWLLVPIFLGLIALLLIMSVKFYESMFKMLLYVFKYDKDEIIVGVLALIDMTLVSTLLVMVAISSYENFISKIDIREGIEKPSLFDKLDPGTIKIKLAVSIVAISSIHLLQGFLSVGDLTDTKVFWMVIIHMVFVFSALFMAWVDKIAFKAHH
ncbi:MAG: TIGR00645 family protein [Alphaproteobacteria bacterium]